MDVSQRGSSLTLSSHPRPSSQLYLPSALSFHFKYLYKFDWFNWKLPNSSTEASSSTPSPSHCALPLPLPLLTPLQNSLIEDKENMTTIMGKRDTRLRFLQLVRNNVYRFDVPTS